jgi:hypothetical protein
VGSHWSGDVVLVLWVIAILLAAVLVAVWSDSVLPALVIVAVGGSLLDRLLLRPRR